MWRQFFSDYENNMFLKPFDNSTTLTLWCIFLWLVEYRSSCNRTQWFFFLIKTIMHQLSQANWCNNNTFTAGNLFPSHSCTSTGVTRVKPLPGFEPMSPEWEADDLPTELYLPLKWFFNLTGRNWLMQVKICWLILSSFFFYICVVMLSIHLLGIGQSSQLLHHTTTWWQIVL